MSEQSDREYQSLIDQRLATLRDCGETPGLPESVAYWNRRAALGPTSGTRDLIAVELERRAISAYVRDGMRVLDVGCGNGAMVMRLRHQHPNLDIMGIDFASEMCEAAWRTYEADPAYGKEPAVAFGKIDIREPKWAINPAPWDIIYSERCIVNLPDWPTQCAAIERIISWLKPGGQYLMVENLQDGVDEINRLRDPLGLPGIVPPWHNRYLRISEICQLSGELERRGIARLDAPVRYSDTYYFLSRIVNAAMARDEGKEPSYDSPVNLLALDLPGGLTTLQGQGVMWVWEKCR